MPGKQHSNASRVRYYGSLRQFYLESRLFIVFFISVVFSCQSYAAEKQILTTEAPNNRTLMDASSEPLQVVVSIRPLALILEELLGEQVMIKTLVPANASPHDYSLKASDVKSLHAADYVVWLGPELEQFMTKLVASLPEKQTITLSDQEFDGHSDFEHHHHHHDEHSDNHQWLDPSAVRVMARKVVAQISELKPELAERLVSDQQAFDKRLSNVEAELDKTLSEVKDVPFVVYHRGYDALVEHFGLNQLGWVTINPEQPPSVRHLVELQQDIKNVSTNKPAKCLFYETSGSVKAAHRIAEQLALKPIALDILGTQATTTSYSELMAALVSSIKSCLE